MYKKIIDIDISKNEYPFYAFLSISNICNANCVFCDVHENKFITPTIDIYKTMDEMKKIGIKYIHFTGGGDPFANKNIFDYFDYATKLGFSIIFLTNGIALNSDKIDQFYKYNIKAMFFSLDSQKSDLHNNIRGVKGCFENLCEVINYSKLKYPKIPIVINHVLSTKNIDDLKEFIKFKSSIKYDYLNPIIVKECPELYFTNNQINNYKNEMQNIKEIANKYDVKFLYDSIDYFCKDMYLIDGSDLRKNDTKCITCKYTCFIDCVSGNVYPCDCCCHRDQDYYSYGSLKNNTLKELFDSQKYRYLQKELYNKESKCKSKCDYANIEFNKFLER